MSVGVIVEQGPIVPTEAAIRKLASLVRSEEEPNMALVVGAKPGGCSGLSWDLYLSPLDSTDIESDAEVCSYSVGEDTVTIVVDSTTAGLARGSTLDHTDGLDGSGFKIANPNAERTCGCGNSFC
jgi:iron-sulfur cluster assembly protein/iron-sulfur cluster insertion protein